MNVRYSAAPQRASPKNSNIRHGVRNSGRSDIGCRILLRLNDCVVYSVKSDINVVNSTLNPTNYVADYIIYDIMSDTPNIKRSMSEIVLNLTEPMSDLA